MDKETLSNYGWIVICVLVLAVMLALASPFGSFVATGVKSTTQGLFDTNQKALNTTGLVSVESQDFNGSIFRNATIPNGGTYTVKATNTTLSEGQKFPDTPATGDIYEEGDYKYRYNSYYNYSDWKTDTEQNGWGVILNLDVTNKYKSSYGKLISEIAGKPVTNMQTTFYTCYSLATAPTIPNSVTNMQATFYNCYSLATAPTIPDSVTNMNSTFGGCKSLTTAPTIPSGVTSMSYTFWNCKSLTTVPGMSNANSVENMTHTFENCTSLTTAPTIPSSVIDMSFAFSNCTALTTAPTIPSGVTDMSYTFENCYNLKTAPTIPSSVTDMPFAFSNCTFLTGTIIINANLKCYNDCFSGTTKPITLTGTSSKLNNIASSYSNVTVASTP